MSPGLSGQVAIVTGAASGIGRASARLFAANGTKVVAMDRSPSVHDTVASIKGAGGYAVGLEGDAGENADVQRAIDCATETYGALHVFYANAGVSGGAVGGIFDAEPDLWLETLRINLIGPLLAIKLGGPMIASHGGGAIVCTASVAGVRSGAGPAHYSASKAGVINLVQTAAQQLAGSGVRVNAVCPGLVETGMTQAVYDHARAAGKEDKIGQLNPTLRGGEPEEIAEAALFLASPKASYINGQAIVVDGGLSSSLPTARKPGDNAGRAAW